MAKPARLRALAVSDIDAALAHLLTEASADVAGRFIDAVERALRRLERHPQSGSLRFAYELDVPDLRSRPLTGFPYVVFYVEGDEQLDVWRVLHTRRDIPELFAPDDDS